MTKRDISLSVDGIVYHTGVCAAKQSVKFLAFLINNRSFIEKLEENEAESQRTETVTVFLVAHQHHLFNMLLLVLVYPTPCHLQLERSHLGNFVFSVFILLNNPFYPSSFATEQILER